MIRFESTNWSEIRLARCRQTPAGETALARLLERYWPALLAYLVRERRLSVDEAEDVLQQFILDKVLERQLLEAADRERGKFRSLLLVSLERFLIDLRRKRSRGLALSEATPVEQLAAKVDGPERFEWNWAEATIAEALSRTCRYFMSTDRPHYWHLFEQRVVRSAYENVAGDDYHELVQSLGFASPKKAKSALVSVKRAFVRQLEALLGDRAADAEASLQELKEIVAKRATRSLS
jgi:DNA-directed RNA polymerase specialized sigma24 family protein